MRTHKLMRDRYAVNNAFTHRYSSFQVFWAKYCSGNRCYGRTNILLRYCHNACCHHHLGRRSIQRKLHQHGCHGWHFYPHRAINTPVSILQIQPALREISADNGVEGARTAKRLIFTIITTILLAAPMA